MDRNILDHLNAAGIFYTHREGSNEILLDCPICVGQGRHRKFGKLYFNVAKRVGLCMRCGWVCNWRQLCQSLHIVGVRWENTNLSFVDETKSTTWSQPLPRDCVHAWEHRRSREYLLSRSVNAEAVERFGLLYCQSGYYEDRIIIPVVDWRCRYRTFVARAVTPHHALTRKYLYPRGSSIGSLLYNIHYFYGKKREVWLVEGIFDAIHCWPYAVCTFGKNLTKSQLMLLRASGIMEVYLLWDSDAWQNTPDKYEHVCRMLREYFIFHDVRLKHDTPTEYAVEELKELCKSGL